MSTANGHEAISRSHKRKVSKQTMEPQNVAADAREDKEHGLARAAPSNSSRDLVTQMPLLVAGLVVLIACGYGAVRATMPTEEVLLASTANVSGQIQVCWPFHYNLIPRLTEGWIGR